MSGSYSDEVSSPRSRPEPPDAIHPSEQSQGENEIEPPGLARRTARYGHRRETGELPDTKSSPLQERPGRPQRARVGEEHVRALRRRSGPAERRWTRRWRLRRARRGAARTGAPRLAAGLPGEVVAPSQQCGGVRPVSPASRRTNQSRPRSPRQPTGLPKYRAIPAELVDHVSNVAYKRAPCLQHCRHSRIPVHLEERSRVT